MGKFRDVYICDTLAVEDSDTLIKNLDFSDPLSAITIRGQATNGATSNKENFISDIITKIEVVDGSDVIASLDMKQLEALHFYHTGGKMPELRPDAGASKANVEEAKLFFGRYLYDKDYWLDCTQFNNPQIKITVDLEKIRSTGDTGYVSGSGRITLIGHTMRDIGKTSQGYLMTKDVYDWTTATSGDETIELPRDYPYKAIMLRAYTAGNDINENITDLKISENYDSFIPFQGDVQDIIEMNTAMYGKARYNSYIRAKHGDTVTHYINYTPYPHVVGKVLGQIAGHGWSWSSQFNLLLASGANTTTGDPVAVSTDQDLFCTVEGQCFHSTIFWPFGDQMNPEDWYDPRDKQSVRLICTQGAASDASVVLQQLRS